jgi:MFS family permease
MCSQCAVLTPVGYRCKECVKGIQDNYYTATQADYALIFGVCAALTAVAAGIVAAIGLPLLFAIILGLPLGGAVAEAGLRLTSRRRGRQSATIAAAGTVVGGILGGVLQTLLAFGPRLAEAGVPVVDFLLRRMTSDLGLLVFIVIAAVAVYGRFKMRS